MKRRVSAWLAWIVALAGGLRIYRLDGQSLWADEGNSVALASRSLTQIASDAASDIHPPLYYWMLHVWVSLFGTSEVAVRSLSVALSLLMIPLVAWLARRLWGDRAGLAAAGFIAVTPFQIYYAQETRMYALATLLGVGAACGIVGFLRTDGAFRLQWRPSLLYILCGTLGLYTHYGFAFLLLAFNLAYAIHLVWTRKQGGLLRRLAFWAGLQSAILLLYLPWLPTAIARGRAWPTVGATPPLSDALTQVGSWLYLGPASTVAQPDWLAWLPLLLAVVAVISRDRETASTIWAWLWLWLILPPLLLLATGAFRAANLKLLLISNPALCLLLGHGWSRVFAQVRGVRAVWHALLLLAVFLPATVGLRGYFTDPRLAKDDYRGIARYIAAVAQPEDAILLNAPGQIEVFRYYDTSGLSTYPLPRQRPPDATATEAELASIAAQHQRLFALFWATDESDPDRIVETWLDRHTFKAFDLWQGNVRFVLYALPAEDGLVPHEIHADFDSPARITLRELSLQDRPVKAGEVLQVSLLWEALAPLDERYKVSIQLLDPADQVIAQRDAEPVGNSHPTSEWQAGETVTDLHGLYISPGTPPGAYQMQVILYDAQSGVRLPLSGGGDALPVGTIEVARPDTPPPIAALRMMAHRQIDWAEVRLMGFDLYRRGYAHAPQTPLRAGDLLHVTFYWQALAKPASAWQMRLEMLDRANAPVTTLDAPLALPSYPTTEWEAGEIVRGDWDMLLPLEMAPGPYPLHLTLWEDGNLSGRTVTIDTVDVAP